jgi:hypothetical protein
MSRLFSYVVDHDLGFSPDPFGGFCTLVHCKFSTDGRYPNIVELAKPDDWVVGTGGLSPRSAGHGRLIYAMKVTEKLPLLNYYVDKRFRGRPNDPRAKGRKRRFALISTDFFYFGSAAVTIPGRFANKPLEKKGPGFRSDFDETFITKFEKWLRRSYRRGVHGRPCGGQPSHATRSARGIAACAPCKAPSDCGCR